MSQRLAIALYTASTWVIPLVIAIRSRSGRAGLNPDIPA
jgi:hypothetical protein